MSSVSDDKLRIPIEIKTEDSKEIQALINDIAEAESDLRAIKPRKGRGSGDTTSRSAYATPFTEGSGIYATQREGETLPSKSRDNSSRAAFNREREWDKTQQRIEELEARNNILMAGISEIGNMLGIAGLAIPAVGGIRGAKGFSASISSGLVAGKSPLSGGGIGKIGSLGGFTGILGKLGGVGFTASLIIDVISGVVEWLQSPGNLLDRRYKRIISDEIAQATERKDKEELRQGIRMIHITPYTTYRGIGTARAAENISTNYGIDTSLEYGAKGL